MRRVCARSIGWKAGLAAQYFSTKHIKVMIKINSEQVCEVRIFDKREHPHYEYREAQKSWFWGEQKAGFYYTLTMDGPDFMTVEEIEKSGELVCVDKTVYLRPRIFIKMSNGDVNYKYFDTKGDAKKYFESAPEFVGIKWVGLD